MPRKNDLSKLKVKVSSGILPIGPASADAMGGATTGESAVTGRKGQVGRPPKAKSEKRDYKVTLSVTQAQGDLIRHKAGLAGEASIIYDHLEKTGFFE